MQPVLPVLWQSDTICKGETDYFSDLGNSRKLVLKYLAPYKWSMSADFGWDLEAMLDDAFVDLEAIKSAATINTGPNTKRVPLGKNFMAMQVVLVVGYWM